MRVKTYGEGSPIGEVKEEGCLYGDFSIKSLTFQNLINYLEPDNVERRQG